VVKDRGVPPRRSSNLKEIWKGLGEIGQRGWIITVLDTIGSFGTYDVASLHRCFVAMLLGFGNLPGWVELEILGSDSLVMCKWVSKSSQWF